MSELAIRVENLSKSYSASSTKGATNFKEELYTSFKNALRGNKQDDSNRIWALKDINFEVERGSVFSIIGKNGAGKSTILKILSSVTAPSTGKIEIYNRVSSLLEIGTGFHPDLKGMENIYFNGLLLGMSRPEITAKIDEIIHFSGIERFINMPVKFYSTGMTIRLAFSIAAHLDPEILIIDEVLSVGDAAFREKSLDKIKEIARKEGTTIIVTSHNFGTIRQISNYGILLRDGELVAQGDIDTINKEYKYDIALDLFQEENADTTETGEEHDQIKQNEEQNELPERLLDLDNKPARESILLKYYEHALHKQFKESDKTASNDQIWLKEARLTAENKAIDDTIFVSDDIRIELIFYKKESEGFMFPTISISDERYNVFFVHCSAFENKLNGMYKAGEYRCMTKIPKDLLNSGLFVLDVQVNSSSEAEAILIQRHVLFFEVLPVQRPAGIEFVKTDGPARPNLNWKISKVPQKST